MKTAIAILLLTATMAFSQATVSYQIIDPPCVLHRPAKAPEFGTPVTCYSPPEIQVDAISTNPTILGFLIQIQYVDGTGQTLTTSVAVFQSVNGVFTLTLPIGQVTVLRVTATELLSGAIAVA